ncbi:MAG: FkbM family methyltransferase [Hyphomonas sp.]
MGLSFPGTQREWKRHPLKAHSFKVLRDMGVPVGTVIDVGILSSTYELIQAYGDTPQILIEPIAEFEDRIRSIYDKSRVNYELIKVAASDYDGETSMRTKSVREGVEITHAHMTSDTSEPGQYRTVPVRKLDTIVQERSLQKPYLLKIDVDGAELSILRGAESVLKDCSVVCIEATMTTVFERSELIRRSGFHLFDIVDLCYYDNRLSQVDLIFLNTQIAQDMGLHIYGSGFEISKWKTYDPK